MLSFVRCRFTPGFHRASGRPLRLNTRPCMNGSDARIRRAMEIFQFDRREKNVGRFGSRGF